MPEAPNAVRELAEDASSRKTFLRKAGGTGVAASLTAFIAACGSDSSMSSSSKATPAATAMASGAEQKAGGKPASKPKAQFPLDSETEILKLAATVENLGANAYLGQAGNIQDKEILAAALSIHSVEARHASVLNLATGAKPAKGPFAMPASADEVLKAVKPFLAT